MKTLSFTLLSSILFSTTVFGVTLSPTNTNNSLIVYNSNIGLVHENRKLQLNKNDTQIIYEDVASSINTDSVNVSLPNAVTLFSQQYRYDKLTQNKLINAHIGKKINVRIMKDAKSFKTIRATLLSNDGASCIVKSDEKIIIIASKNIIFPSIPKELITKPSLVWNVATSKNINEDISIDYLINQITWKSNYILNLDGDEADLTGWITINNHSGKSFEETNLHVLAGEINRAVKANRNYRVVKSMARVQYDSPEVAHKAHEGYHFYTIPFKVNLVNNETTQIKFITQNDIQIKRKYSSVMSNPNYINGQINHDVTQFITIKGLDYPLPKGIVRTYSQLEATNILLGESSIKHTPKDSRLSLKVGKNFDIKVKETLLNHDKRKYNLDVDVEYSITNNSNEEKIVEILIPFNKNDGSEVKSKKKYTFTKANLVTFHIKVNPQSTKKFKVYYTTKVQR